MVFRRVLLLIFLFLSISGGYASELDLTVAEQEWLSEHPVIRLGVGTSFPPIQWVSEVEGEDTYSGIASDYVAILSALIGIDFQIEYGITFTEALEKGRRREIDLFPCLAYSDERSEFLDFTAGYLENPLVVFANDDAPFIGSVEDLSGLRVADVEALYVYRKLKQDVPGINFVFRENAEQCLEAVAFGRADANVAGLVSGSYMIRRNNWSNIRVAAPTPYPNTVFRMGIRNDWPELASIINKALQTIDHDAHNEISQKWVAVRYEHGIRRSDVIRRILAVVAAAAFIIAATMFWVHKLRIEVKQRKAAEEALSSALGDKELLIREVYHRVKNNLSLVAGLVSLQAGELSDPADTARMQVVTQRIRSIILLHEKLSLAADMQNVDVGDYISELVDAINDARTDRKDGIRITYDSVREVLDEGILIPLGLIINELVMNALKYGFDDRDTGLIEIILQAKRGNCLELTVRNNGTPIPDSFDPDRPSSLGLLLVSNLILQLNGELKLKRAPHPEFVISFCRSSKPPV